VFEKNNLQTIYYGLRIQLFIKAKYLGYATPGHGSIGMPASQPSDGSCQPA